MQIHEALTDWTGETEQIETIEQFARDFAWEEPIKSPAFAADAATSALIAEIDAHPEAVRRLHAALEQSAERAKAASA